MKFQIMQNEVMSVNIIQPIGRIKICLLFDSEPIDILKILDSEIVKILWIIMREKILFWKKEKTYTKS